MALPADQPTVRRVPTAQPNVLVLKMSGEFDLSARETLRASADAALADAPVRIIVDAKELTFADSVTLRELLRMQRAVAERGGPLVIVGAQPALKRVLLATGLDAVFEHAADAQTSPAEHPAKGE